MSSIRSLVLIAGLALLVAPAAFAEGDEASMEVEPPAEAMAQPPAEAVAQPPAEAVAQPPAKAMAESAAEARESVAPSEAAAEVASRVARALFTTVVADREPGDELSVVRSPTNPVYFFTELRDLDGQRVTHRWEQGGEVRGEVQFDVGGPRWRVWSSKEILPEWTGEWRVRVLDEGGAELATRSFSYQAQE